MIVIKIFDRNCLYWQLSEGRGCQGKSQKVTLSMHSLLTPLLLLISPRKKNKTRQNKIPKDLGKILTHGYSYWFLQTLIWGLWTIILPPLCVSYFIPQPCHSQVCWFYLGLSLHFPENSSDLYGSPHLEFPSSLCHLLSINISLLTSHMKRVAAPIKVISFGLSHLCPSDTCYVPLVSWDAFESLTRFPNRPGWA